MRTIKLKKKQTVELGEEEENDAACSLEFFTHN